MSKIPQTQQDKIAVAQKLKLEGNEYFLKNEYKKALNTYKKVFLYINGLNTTLGDVYAGQKGKPESDEILKLRSTVNMNISFCYFKTEQVKRSLEYIQLACTADPSNNKCKYRRGQIYLALGDLDLAKKDLQIALDAFPSDQNVLSDWKLLEAKFVEFERKEKKMFQKMFQ